MHQILDICQCHISSGEKLIHCMLLSIYERGGCERCVRVCVCVCVCVLVGTRTLLVVWRVCLYPCASRGCLVHMTFCITFGRAAWFRCAPGAGDSQSTCWLKDVRQQPPLLSTQAPQDGLSSPSSAGLRHHWCCNWPGMESAISQYFLYTVCPHPPPPTTSGPKYSLYANYAVLWRFTIWLRTRLVCLSRDLYWPLNSMFLLIALDISAPLRLWNPVYLYSGALRRLCLCVTYSRMCVCVRSRVCEHARAFRPKTYAPAPAFVSVCAHLSKCGRTRPRAL